MRKIMKATLGMTARNRKIRNLMNTQRNQENHLMNLRERQNKKIIQTRILNLGLERVIRQIQEATTIRMTPELMEKYETEMMKSLTVPPEILGNPPTNPE